MEVSQISQQLITAKVKSGKSFSELGALLGHDEVWVAALLYGQASASLDEIEKLKSVLPLTDEQCASLAECPLKGLGPVVPTDPLIYRFYEIMQVYGMPMKAIIHDKFGDGIMSAVDFSLNIDKVEDPKGDRVVVTMNGKFLPYKKF